MQTLLKLNINFFSSNAAQQQQQQQQQLQQQQQTHTANNVLPQEKSEKNLNKFKKFSIFAIPELIEFSSSKTDLKSSIFDLDSEKFDVDNADKNEEKAEWVQPIILKKFKDETRNKIIII